MLEIQGIVLIWFFFVYFQMMAVLNFEDTRVEGCWRRRHQNIPHSLDCYGTGLQRMFGEVLESWGYSQNAIFWNIQGRNTFQAILSNLQVSDSTLDLPRDHIRHDPLYKYVLCSI